MAEGVVIACHKIDEWKEQIKTAKDSNKLIVIDFTASWCPPCKFIAPIFAEYAKKYPGVIFFKVDVDELQQVAQEYEVEAMPTFVFLKEGKVVHKIVGAQKDELESKIVEHGITASASA